MKATQIISVSILGALMCAPLLTSAQIAGSASGDVVVTDTSASADGSAGGSVVAPPPALIRESPTKQNVISPRDPASGLPTGKRQYQPVIIRKVVDKASPQLMMVGPDGKPVPQNVNSPRDVESGKATGRMMASGTRPLPPQIKRELELRDKQIGSGTPLLGERKERIDEKRQEMQQRKEERRSEILKRMSRQMIGRMDAAIERLVKLADRVDSRIAKLKEKGVDTREASINIAITRTKLTEAKAAVAAAEASVLGAAANADAIMGTTTSSDAGKPVRDALEQARVAIVAAHKALVIAVESLKANVKIEVGSPSSTTSSTAN